jgi:hypothetical protein
MSSPASGSLRGLRVAIVAAAGTLLAAAAHVAAGGSLPSAGATATGAVIPAMAGLWMTGKRRGWLSIAAVLGAVQVVLHTWLMAGSTGSCLVSGGGHAAHAASATLRCTSAGMPGMVPGRVSLAMILAHAIAVVLTSLVLAAGERAVWQLLLWLRPAVQAACSSLPVLPRRRWVPVVAVVPVHRLCSVDLGGSGRRGPPSASF